MSMGRFRDGKMVEGWNNWDQMSLMEQLQATPRTVKLLS
jgi:predicted ester cyclase